MLAGRCTAFNASGDGFPRRLRRRRPGMAARKHEGMCNAYVHPTGTILSQPRPLFASRSRAEERTMTGSRTRKQKGKNDVGL